MMTKLSDQQNRQNLWHRRYFLNRMSTGLGGFGLATLLGSDADARHTNQPALPNFETSHTVHTLP